MLILLSLQRRSARVGEPQQHELDDVQDECLQVMNKGHTMPGSTLFCIVPTIRRAEDAMHRTFRPRWRFW